jgi:lysophospholipase L1-like esterase
MTMRAAIGAVLVIMLSAAGCHEGHAPHEYSPLPGQPDVLIIGDSISMQGGYFPGLVERLGEGHRVAHNAGNGGDSTNVLKNLDEWVTAADPDIIHFNCGLHDLKFDRLRKTHQQEPDAYERNLREIVAYLKTKTRARLVFALTTPVNEEWHHKNKPFDRRQVDVDQYNVIARRVMAEHDIAVNDLHRVIAEAGPDTCLKQDGVHMNEKGNALLADAVAAAIRKVTGRTAHW